MTDTNDVVTLAEAKSALKISNDGNNTNLAFTITAVSRLLDERCGPVVRRVDTNTVLVTDPTSVKFTYPIHAVGSVTSHDGDTDTVLSASNTNGYRLTERTSGTGNYTGTITRIGGTFGERVTLNATFGRYESTAVVDSRFKVAAFDIIRNLWRAEEIGVGSVDGFDVPYPTFPASYSVPNAVRDLLGDDWLGVKNSAHTGVMFG